MRDSELQMSQRLGRVATPQHRLATVPMLSDHISLATTLVADSCDYAQRMTEPWGMLGNDRFGCCVFAAMAHLKQQQSANSVGDARDFTDAKVLSWYALQTGFDPMDPSTDNGAIPLDALKWFVEIGEVIAFARVDPRNDAHVAAAIELFGGLYSGWDLPRAWQGASEWNAGPNQLGDWLPGSWGGHMVSQTGYDIAGNTPTVTWGQEIGVTWSARWVYCSEAYAVITREWIDARGKSIQGFDLEGLKARLAEVK
jgi:hypothetical protein